MCHVYRTRSHRMGACMRMCTTWVRRNVPPPHTCVTRTSLLRVHDLSVCCTACILSLSMFVFKQNQRNMGYVKSYYPHTWAAALFWDAVPTTRAAAPRTSALRLLLAMNDDASMSYPPLLPDNMHQNPPLVGRQHAIDSNTHPLSTDNIRDCIRTNSNFDPNTQHARHRRDSTLNRSD